MNKIDFSTYKLRASFLPALMTNPTAAAMKRGDVLSETSKAQLRELWVKVVYEREKYDKTNKYTEKGIACEPDSMDLIQKVTGLTYFKNKTQFENEYITGTPDIVEGKDATKMIIDVKTSWSMNTYMDATEDKAHKDYYYQLLGYMWLTGATASKLMYCLVNTPEEIMNDEMYKLSFKIKGLGTDQAVDDKIKKNFIFDDVDPNSRLKIYPLALNEDDIALLKDKIIAAREYLATLKL